MNRTKQFRCSTLILLTIPILILTSCTTVERSAPATSPPMAGRADPAVSPSVAEAPVAPEAPSLEQLHGKVQMANYDLNEALIKYSDKTAYKKAWDAFLPAIDALLNHPDSWSFDPTEIPLKLETAQPDYRVFSEEGYYQYLGEDPTLKNFWVQWRDADGTTHAQVLYRGTGRTEQEARAYGPLVLLLFGGAPARLEAWQLKADAWQRVTDPLQSVGDRVGETSVAHTAAGLEMAGGWWRQFTRDGSQRDYSGKGEVFLCPSFDSASLQCFRLQVTDGQISLATPESGDVADMSTPARIAENLSIGYGKEGVDPSAAREAAARAVAGLEAHLQLPLWAQEHPKHFNGTFQSLQPGSAQVFDLAPNIRVYSMITRPEYQPEARAWIQWWSNPDDPHLQAIELEMFDRLIGAALFGPESAPVLVYTTATFPTRPETGRSAVALRLDATQNRWVPDGRAFPENLPKALGEVAIFRFPTGSGLGMTRPQNPPVGNPVRIGATGLTICDTDDLCIRLTYKENQFVAEP